MNMDPLLGSVMSGDHVLMHGDNSHCLTCANPTTPNDSAFLSCGCGPVHYTCLAQSEYSPQRQTYIPDNVVCRKCQRYVSLIQEPIPRSGPRQHVENSQRQRTPPYKKTPSLPKPSLYPRPTPVSAPQPINISPVVTPSSPYSMLTASWPMPEIRLPGACADLPGSGVGPPGMSPFSSVTPSAPLADDVSVVGEGLSFMNSPPPGYPRGTYTAYPSNASTTSSPARHAQHMPSVPSMQPPSPTLAAQQAMRDRSRQGDRSRQSQSKERKMQGIHYGSRVRSDFEGIGRAPGSNRRIERDLEGRRSREAPVRNRSQAGGHSESVRITKAEFVRATRNDDSAEFQLNIQVDFNHGPVRRSRERAIPRPRQSVRSISANVIDSIFGTSPGRAHRSSSRKY